MQCAQHVTLCVSCVGVGALRGRKPGESGESDTTQEREREHIGALEGPCCPVGTGGNGGGAWYTERAIHEWWAE